MCFYWSGCEKINADLFPSQWQPTPPQSTEMPKMALDRKKHHTIHHHLQANTRISLICYTDSLKDPVLKMIICKRGQVWTKSLKRWTLMDYDTVARNPVLLRALSPSNTQKGKCETPEAQREQFVHCRDQNKETFSTSLLQEQWLKKTHLQDTLNYNASPSKHEQEGIRDKCSRSSNAICGIKINNF